MASDSIQTQKDIFAGIQGLLAFLDTTDEKKNRENLEAWKNTLESLRDITSNPLPFLLELLKVLILLQMQLLLLKGKLFLMKEERKLN